MTTRATRPHVRNDIGKANERWIASYRDMAGAVVLDEFRSVTARRLDDLRALTGADWDREGFTPEGPGPYRQFMAIRVFDCWYHDEDIREALDRPGYLEGPVADHSLGCIPPKGLPYVVGKKAGAPAGSTVVFDVAGTPPIVASVLVPPEGRAVLLDARAGRSDRDGRDGSPDLRAPGRWPVVGGGPGRRGRARRRRPSPRRPRRRQHGLHHLRPLFEALPSAGIVGRFDLQVTFVTDMPEV